MAPITSLAFPLTCLARPAATSSRPMGPPVMLTQVDANKRHTERPRPPQRAGRNSPPSPPHTPGGAGGMKFKRPPLVIQPTTLWEYPSQDYGEGQQGRAGYKGATPSYIIWNLLQRYTKEKDLVVDAFAGSGTTLDVARDLNRRALGYDVHPTRK